MSYPYKTEHKEMSLHCNFLTIKHYYRKVKGACIIISFLKSLTSQGVYDFPYQSSSLLPIEAFPCLIALRHILQHRYHFLAKALRSQHDEIPAMPKHLLQEVVARANGQVIFTIHAVWRFPHPLLTLMLWHFLNVVVLRIEGTDANLLWLYIVHFIDAKAILVITIGSQESPHLRRQRMLLANHLHIENSVERKIPHSLLLIGKGIISLGTWIGFPFGRRTLFLHSSFFTLHSYHIPSLLEESHKGRLQHHVLLLAISRGVEELQEILLVYRTEDVIQIFRMIRRFVEYHLVVVLQQVAQGGEAHGTQHPLRHIVTLHGVFLQIIA